MSEERDGDWRTDKFSVGDKVVWFNEYYATTTDARSRLGPGPFTVIEVSNPSFCPSSRTNDGQSNWSSMGHTQHVTVASSAPGNHIFSGAFFAKSEART